MPRNRNVILKKFFFLAMEAKGNFLNLTWYLQCLPYNSLKTSFFDTYMIPGIKKILQLYCTYTRQAHSYPKVSFYLLLEMYMEFKWQPLHDRERRWSTFIWPLGAKWKFQILTAHLQDVPNHILEFQSSITENVDVHVVQVKSFIEKWKHIFSTIIWPLGKKKKIPKPYCSSTRHTQWYPKLSSSRVPVTTSPKTSFFGPYFTARAKLKFPKL